MRKTGSLARIASLSQCLRRTFTRRQDPLRDAAARPTQRAGKSPGRAARCSFRSRPHVSFASSFRSLWPSRPASSRERPPRPKTRGPRSRRRPGECRRWRGSSTSTGTTTAACCTGSWIWPAGSSCTRSRWGRGSGAIRWGSTGGSCAGRTSSRRGASGRGCCSSSPTTSSGPSPTTPPRRGPCAMPSRRRCTGGSTSWRAPATACWWTPPTSSCATRAGSSTRSRSGDRGSSSWTCPAAPSICPTPSPSRRTPRSRRCSRSRATRPATSSAVSRPRGAPSRSGSTIPSSSCPAPVTNRGSPIRASG